MLNVCIGRRLHREANSKRNRKEFLDEKSLEEEDDNDDDDEGEFFDCDDPSIASGFSMKVVLNLKPEGRLRRLNDERLLEDLEEYIYIPETQEPVPKTEDQLQDDAEVMLKLGPGSGITTQMMCTSLLSDMEAFKAANPKGKMEDFIRWYSPKDWEEIFNDTGKARHQLSVRMTTEGNTWQKVWEQAQAVPVNRQKRLFDDTNEALKVLHYLETRKIKEIYNLTVIPLLHSAVLKLIEIFSNAKVEDLFGKQIDKFLSDLCRVSRSQLDDRPQIQPLLDDFAELERRFYQFKCFQSLSACPKTSSLSQVKIQFEEILRNENCCTIVNRRLTAAGDGTLYDILIPKLEEDMAERLVSKDYIIRLDGNSESTRNGFYLGPHFMRAIVTGEKLRLCGAFTESTAFI